MKLYTLVPLGLLLIAATASADTAVYDLDAKNAKEIADAINDTLALQCRFAQNGAEFSSCGAELLSTGQLLVEAPAASQAQVAAALKAIAARNSGPAPRITLQYSGHIWGAREARRGRPCSKAAQRRSSTARTCARRIGLLGARYRECHGAVRDERELCRRAARDKPDRARDRRHRRSQRLSSSFHRPPASQTLKVSVTIKRGEFLVLAERTTEEPGKDTADKPEKPEKPGRSGTLFYVVHWPPGQ